MSKNDCEKMKTSIDLPTDLYNKIKYISDKEVRSVNGQIVFFLNQSVSRIFTDNKDGFSESDHSAPSSQEAAQ